MIYHISHVDEFTNASLQGYYSPSNFEQDGFVHCSTQTQVVPVANKRFLNLSNLVLLEIDEKKLPQEAIFENLEGGLELFPHIYCQIPYTAITRYAYLQSDIKGFSFPSEWISIDHL